MSKQSTKQHLSIYEMAEYTSVLNSSKKESREAYSKFIESKSFQHLLNCSTCLAELWESYICQQILLDEKSIAVPQKNTSVVFKKIKNIIELNIPLSFQFFQINFSNSNIIKVKEKEALAFRSDESSKMIHKNFQQKSLSQGSYHFFHNQLKGILLQLNIEILSEQIKISLDFIGCKNCLKQVYLEEENKVIEVESLYKNKVEFVLLKEQLGKTFRLLGKLGSMKEEKIELIEIKI